MKKANTLATLVFSLLLLSGCNSNPSDKQLAGTGIGAAVGAGTAALLGGSKNALIASGVAGGAIGYYLGGLQYTSNNITTACGQVYRVGDLIGINIPSDQLFLPNTAEFTPQAEPILDSVGDILNRYPNNNILISGNTSGFDRPKREQELSEKRAQKVAFYLWNTGISQYKEPCLETKDSDGLKKLTYVGYGDYLPIASTETLHGLRQNSRIQITSYPTNVDLRMDKRRATMRNVGALDDDTSEAPCPSKTCKS